MVKYSNNAAPYDNFHSPLNKEFYDGKQYSDLNTSRNEIRLLEVLPAGDDGLLQCNLVTGCFLAPGSVPLEYEAISYCAGDPGNTNPIKVNNITFNVFANLECGLRCIVQQREENKTTDCVPLLWVDQICINQSNHDERSDQVSQMCEIFSQANRIY